MREIICLISYLLILILNFFLLKCYYKEENLVSRDLGLIGHSFNIGVTIVLMVDLIIDILNK